MPHPEPSITHSGQQRRFLRWWGCWTVSLAVIAGIALTLEDGWALLRYDLAFGGLLVALSVALRLVRSLAPAVACSATIISVVCWSDGMEPWSVRRLRRTMLVHALLFTALGSYLVLVVAGATGWVVARTVFSLPPNDFLAGVDRVLRREDLGFHLLSTLLCATVAGGVTWSCLPSFARWRGRLRSKIAILWAVGAVFQVAMAFLTRN